jgi:hypothetical protein
LKNARTLRFGGALVAVVALGAVGSGGFATASPGKPKAEDTAVVKMVQDGRELFFEGPETVARGAELKFKNTTDPQKIGPHTASLVKRSEFPRTDDEIKACAKKFKKICGAIVKWHQVDLQTGEVGRNPVEVDGKGWDLQGSLKHAGDSWVSERKNQSFKQKVTAPEGKTLHFICAVHPEMQGKIRVVEG